MPRGCARRLIAGAVLATGFWCAPVGAGDEDSRRPTVVELFTSQSCYSCPPAEAFLSELAERPGVIALEFHVDYWNDLVYGAAGKWKDPFSSPMATARQRQYAAAIGSGRSYTPQMVVDGRLEGVGSHRSTILAAIAEARDAAATDLTLTVEARSGGGLRIRLDDSGAQAGSVLLVLYDLSHTTEVLAGENKGKQLTNRNVVRELRTLADWPGGPLELDVEAASLAAAEGCAVLVQAARHGPILNAARCPGADAS